jgi:hypothetical protein
LIEKRSELVKFFIFWILGLSLSAITLIPFLEYLPLSTAWEMRSVHGQSLLPLTSSIQFIFPYILGAPQTAFYKSFSGTNFQESSAGYVGVIILILGIAQLMRKRFDTLTVFWGLVGLVSMSIAYGLIPGQLLMQIPLLSHNANQRFIVITGFSLVVLATLKFSDLLNERPSFSSVVSGRIFVAFGLLILVPFFVPLALSLGRMQIPEAFIGFLQLHVALQCFSTVIFFVALFLLERRSGRQFFVLLFCILIQSLGLFLELLLVHIDKELLSG